MTSGGLRRLVCVDQHCCRAATSVVVVCGVPAPDQVQAICDRVRDELASPAVERALVLVLATRIDLGLVDLLARLTVTARRTGAVVRVVPDGDDLQALLQLTGLDRELGRDCDLRSGCGRGSSCDHREG